MLVLASLVAKRHLEKRKRPWRIWMWDVGKQMTGQAVVHGLNLLVSLASYVHSADIADFERCRRRRREQSMLAIFPQCTTRYDRRSPDLLHLSQSNYMAYDGLVGERGFRLRTIRQSTSATLVSYARSTIVLLADYQAGGDN